MARVYLARHTTLRTLHAIKVLTMTGPSLKDRLVAEGRVQARLRHPNIVRVSDVLEVDGMQALVMDYIDGPDLARWIATERPDPELAEQVFRGIVAGVQAAHDAGVAHRDLKPANVLMAHENDRWIPKVSDFGLVKALQGESQTWKTRSGLPMGTPQYMAPEQIRDAANIDHRADLFSLGCILFELLAHQPAYTGADILEIFERVRAEERADLPRSTPAHLRHAVEQCLKLDPSQRPDDCAALLSLLDGRAPKTPARRVATGPPSASRSSVAVGLGVGAVAAGALLVAVVMGVGATLWWSSLPSAPGGCPTTAGLVGYARAPVLFTKGRGSTWSIPRDLDVMAAMPDGETDPEVVCVLEGGTKLELLEPIEQGWIPVYGEAIGGPQEEDEEAGGEPATDCPEAEDGAIIGYATARPFLLPQGAMWRVNSTKEVYGDYPREENDFEVDTTAVICRIPVGTNVLLEEAPIRVRKAGVWIPIVGGAIQDQ